MSETQRNATVLRRETFSLPENVNPTGLRCLQILIPDDDEYLLSLAGALQLLAKWNSWERDELKQGRLVAQVWERALAVNDFAEMCNLPAPGGLMEDFEMPIRVDCDCNVFITCCNGTEKQILTASQVEDAIRGLSKGDEKQPQPGGGCATYNKSVTGKDRALIPVPVSTGDTIHLMNWSGASNEHGFLRWLCGDGGEYFAGACGGFTYFSGSAYMPAVPLGTLIVNVNGTWYDGRSLITVPGGVSNIQPFVTLNYDPASGLSGTLTFDAEVCNNATLSWCHKLDYTINDGGMALAAFGGTWVAGQGWKTTDHAGNSSLCITRALSAPLVISRWTIEVNAVSVGGSTGTYLVDGTACNDVSGGSAGTPIVTGIQTFDFTESLTFADHIGHYLQVSSTGHDIYIKSLMVYGTGTDPFGTPNC